MGLPRYAARKDRTEPWLVQLIRGCGAYVHILEDPCDLLVAHRGRVFLVEVKTDEKTAQRDAKGQNKTQCKQRAFRDRMAEKGVHVWTVWSEEQVRGMLA